MVVEPMVSAVARPAEPTAFEMLATVGVDELHVTTVVRSLVVESLYVPVAPNACDPPVGMLLVAGVMAIDVSQFATVQGQPLGHGRR